MQKGDDMQIRIIRLERSITLQIINVDYSFTIKRLSVLR